VSAERRTFVAFGFASVHDTLLAEDALRSAGVPSVTIPSPKELGELCGIALRVLPDDADAAESVLVSSGASARARAEISDF
jgi:ribosomal protein L7Ae-like RNA K-turn-binding protein